MFKPCTCRDCKRAKRKGKILGTRRGIFWIDDGTGQRQLYDGPVSDYVPYHRYRKGRRPEQKVRF